MPTQGPCWDGYVQKGMKMKNGKQVPNCVPAGKKKEKKSGSSKKAKVKS
jgi:hypothetical protein